MTNLIPRDSFFQDLFDFRRDFDQIFNRILFNKSPMAEQSVPMVFDFLPAVETYLDNDSRKFICRVSLPGVDAKDVEIQAKNNVLAVKGERKITQTLKDVDLMDGEIVYGKFERTFSMLEITAPVAAAAMPRKVEIKVVPNSKQIAA